MKHDKITEYWNEFLESTDKDKSLAYFECFHFDVHENSANELLKLVLEGKKTAMASSLYYFENNSKPLPKPGDLSIVADWQGDPRCIIETISVIILPFKDMTYEICSREGEDENLESWQSNHIKFFTAEGKIENYEFSWDMPVVFEDFEVVYR